MTNIALAGLTAAGKTTHARRLASDLGYEYVSATDILLEILHVPDPVSDLWFTQLDAITAARDGGAVDAELEARLIDLAGRTDLAAGFAAEQVEIRALIGSPNQVEAVTARFEKRDPDFSEA